MNRINIGAFEAKTYFSKLLKEVELGNIVHVTRRGKHSGYSFFLWADHNG